MELCLELNPDRYTIVLGPQFVTALLSHFECEKRPTLSYCDIVYAGIGVASSTIDTEAERAKFELLHRNAYELDPLFAYAKVSAKLRKLNLYDQWLRSVFQSPGSVSATDSLQHLLELQKKGALLMYTHCDDTLDRAVSLPPVLMEDVTSWATGETPGFLHVHGIYSKPDSVKLDYAFYDNSTHPHYADGQALCEYMKGRRALCIGFDNHRDDPLQAKFLESLSRNVDPDHHHIIITSAPRADDPFLTLHAPVDMKGLEGVLKTVAESSQALWNQIEFPSNHIQDCLVISLLVAGKQGCSEISSLMFKAPGVNFVLISPLSYGGGHVHTVLIRVQTAQLQSLWNWIFVAENASLVAKGLVGVALRCGTIIWIKGPPPSNAAGLSLKEECANALLCLSDTSQRYADDRLNETLMKSLLLSKTTALTPPPLTRIPNLLHNETVSTVAKSRTAQLCCTNSKLYTAGIKEEVEEDSQLADHSGLPGFNKVRRRNSLSPQLLTRPMEEGPTLSQNDAKDVSGSLPPLLSSLEQQTPWVLKAHLLGHGRKRNSLAPGEGSTLRSLLQSKSAPVDSLAKRRKSDPGTQIEYLNGFERRKELFVKESKTWSERVQKFMEKKIKRQREMKHRGSPLLQGDKPKEVFVPKTGQNNGSPPLSNHSIGVSTQPAMSSPPTTCVVTSAKVTPTAAPAMLLQARYPPGISPYVFPQPIVTVSSASSTTPSMLYNPLLPYTFYHPAAPGPAYFVPPTSSTRKLLYFVPTSNPGVPVTSNDGSPSYPPLGVPLSLVAPLSATATAKQETVKGSPPPPQTNQRRSNQVLSALLKNASPAERDSDPETPPPAKRKRSGDSSGASSSEGSQFSSMIGKDLRMLLEKQQSVMKSKESEGDDGVRSPTVADSGASAPLISAVASGEQHQVQLWQFLLELLVSDSQLIRWTGQDLEFQINQPDKVAELWGKVRNDPKMTYQKLAKGLCYYYTQGILKSVPEKMLTFRYTSWLKNYISTKCDSAKQLVVVE